MADPKYGREAFLATTPPGGSKTTVSGTTADMGLENPSYTINAQPIRRASAGDTALFAAAAQVEYGFTFTIEWKPDTFALFGRKVNRLFGFEFGEFGNASGASPANPKDEFNALLTGVTVNFDQQGILKANLTFQISGSVTEGTY